VQDREINVGVNTGDVEDVLKVLLAADIVRVAQVPERICDVLARIPVPAEPVSKRMMTVLDTRLDAHRDRKRAVAAAEAARMRRHAEQAAIHRAAERRAAARSRPPVRQVAPSPSGTMPPARPRPARPRSSPRAADWLAWPEPTTDWYAALRS
jgi:hypothetical protein